MEILELKTTLTEIQNTEGRLTKRAERHMTRNTQNKAQKVKNDDKDIKENERYIYLYLYLHAQSCPTLCYPMDWSLPGSAVHGIFQATWSGLLFPPPGDLLNPGTEPTFPMASALAGGFFITEPPGKPTKRIIMCRIRDLKEQNREKRPRSIFEYLITQNFLKLLNGIEAIKEVIQRTPKRKLHLHISYIMITNERNRKSQNMQLRVCLQRNKV